MTEQRIGKDIVIQPGDIDRNPGLVCPAQVMNGSCDQLFADAALPGDQQRLGAAGDGLQVLKKGLHPPVAGNDPGKNCGIIQSVLQNALLQTDILLLQALVLEGALDCGNQSLGVVGLNKIVPRSVTHASHRCLNLVNTANNNHRDLRIIPDDQRQ